MDTLTTTASAYGDRVLADMPGCAIALGPRGTIVYANDPACSIMGIGPYVGKPFGQYFAAHAAAENDEFYEVFLQAVHNKGVRNLGRCPFTAPDGTRYMLLVTSSLVEESDGGSYLVITCTDVSEEERLEHLRRESTFVFLSGIVYLCLAVFCYAFWNYYGRPFEPPTFTIVLEVLGVILGFVVYKNTSLTLADLGLGTKNLAHNLKVDGIASLGLIAFFAVAKLILMRVAPGIIVHPETFYDPSWKGPARIFPYALTAVVQEFLSRGIMQESLTHVIAHEKSETIAIAISTLMFAAIHLHYSPYFMLGAAVLLGVFGVIYRKQRSIWGLALIHFTFGTAAGMFGLI